MVVDCAPTAETIRLLSLPDVLARYMERLFPVGRTVNRVVSPLLARVSGLPTADDSVFAATQRFYDRLAAVREILTDGRRTSIRLVVNPERLVIAEARRTHTYLSLYGYHVDAVVANRLLPGEVSDPWFARWKALQAEHLATIHEAFAPLPIIEVGLQPGEPVGFDALRAFAEVLYGDEDATARFGASDPLRVVGRDGNMALEVELPFTELGEVELSRRADELLLRVGPYRRAVMLPDSLRRRDVAGARLADGCLTVSSRRPAPCPAWRPRMTAVHGGTSAPPGGVRPAGAGTRGRRAPAGGGPRADPGRPSDAGCGRGDGRRPRCRGPTGRRHGRRGRRRPPGGRSRLALGRGPVGDAAGSGRQPGGSGAPEGEAAGRRAASDRSAGAGRRRPRAEPERRPAHRNRLTWVFSRRVGVPFATRARRWPLAYHPMNPQLRDPQEALCRH